MNWIEIALLLYGAFCFIVVFIGVLQAKEKFFISILMLIIFTIVFSIYYPIAAIILPVVVLYSKNDKYETFTIHELTEANKTTLRELQFYERNDLVSATNFEYSGFRKHGISVCYNGRVSVRYKSWLGSKEKLLIDIIKKLPDDKKEKAE